VIAKRLGGGGSCDCAQDDKGGVAGPGKGELAKRFEVVIPREEKWTRTTTGIATQQARERALAQRCRAVIQRAASPDCEAPWWGWILRLRAG